MADSELRDLQEAMKDWQAHNFPDRETWVPLVGMMEELGELAHAVLKEHQNIRAPKNGGTWKEAKSDAVGDIMIYMADFCNGNGLDMITCLRQAWGEVRERDWKKYPKNGRSE